MVHTSLMRLKDHITLLEGKEERMNSESATIQQLLTKLEKLDGEFKTYHFAIVHLVEKENFGEVQVVLDDNDNKILLLNYLLTILLFVFIIYYCLQGPVLEEWQQQKVTTPT